MITIVYLIQTGNANEMKTKQKKNPSNNKHLDKQNENVA